MVEAIGCDPTEGLERMEALWQLEMAEAQEVAVPDSSDDPNEVGSSSDIDQRVHYRG